MRLMVSKVPLEMTLNDNKVGRERGRSFSRFSLPLLLWTAVAPTRLLGVLGTNFSKTVNF